jgi:hypothetical protein
MKRTIAAAAFILAGGFLYAQTDIPRPTGTSLPRARATARPLPTGGGGDIIPRALPRMTPLEPTGAPPTGPAPGGVPTGAPGAGAAPGTAPGTGPDGAGPTH